MLRCYDIITNTSNYVISTTISLGIRITYNYSINDNDDMISNDSEKSGRANVLFFI